jgi:hypothetical protein
MAARSQYCGYLRMPQRHESWEMLFLADLEKIGIQDLGATCFLFIFTPLNFGGPRNPW